MPKFNVNQVLTNTRGENITEPVKLKDDSVEMRDMKLGDVLEMAALTPSQESQKQSMQDKLKLYRIARKLADASKSEDGLVELASEEVTAIKKAVFDLFPSPLLCGAVHDILEA